MKYEVYSTNDDRKKTVYAMTVLFKEYNSSTLYMGQITFDEA